MNVSPGESGCPGARGDQQEAAGPHASYIRRCPAADLHADAQGLLPTIPLLQHLQVARARQLTHLLRVLVPRQIPPLLVLMPDHFNASAPHTIPTFLSGAPPWIPSHLLSSSVCSESRIPPNYCQDSSTAQLQLSSHGSVAVVLHKCFYFLAVCAFQSGALQEFAGISRDHFLKTHEASEHT